MSPRDRCPVRTPPPRHPSGKDHWNQWSLTIWRCCSWNKLLVHMAGGELAHWLSLVSPKVFSPFCHWWSFGSLPLSPMACLIIIIISYIYIALFLDTQSTLHSKGAISSSTTNVQHPPGWCDGSHSAPERPPHTSLLVERRQSDEANQCMGMIRRPWWSEASGLVWPGCRDNTPTLFRRTSWDF